VEGFIHAAAGRPDAARRAYQVALASLDGLSAPHEEALTRLDYGRFLRHHSQRRAALRELYAARATFARLGAVPFLARCDAELGHEVPTVSTIPTAPAVPATTATPAPLTAWPRTGVDLARHDRVARSLRPADCRAAAAGQGPAHG
jgi:hypothetical protein